MGRVNGLCVLEDEGDITFKTLGNTHPTIQCHIPGDPNPQPLVIQSTQTQHTNYICPFSIFYYKYNIQKHF
jgi:hypothetical protein